MTERERIAQTIYSFLDAHSKPMDDIQETLRVVSDWYLAATSDLRRQLAEAKQQLADTRKELNTKIVDANSIIREPTPTERSYIKTIERHKQQLAATQDALVHRQERIDELEEKYDGECEMNAKLIERADAAERQLKALTQLLSLSANTICKAWCRTTNGAIEHHALCLDVTAALVAKGEGEASK